MRIGTPLKHHREEVPFDAIVVGSGIGGLTAAAILAREAGKRVLVLERHYTAGRQRDAAGRFGSDPRNPYANEIFQQVYELIEAKKLEKMPAPQQRR